MVQAACLVLTPSTTGAQQTSSSAAVEQPPRPSYLPLRYDEDWTALRDPSRRTDAWDVVKYIPLGAEHRYLTLGGETRIRFERFVNPSFGSAPDDRSGYLLQRHLFHADLHVGTPLRLFAQVQSGLESGRVGGPRPTDEDRLDLHQAFVDLQKQRGTRSLTLRVGRQEIELGSSRFISAREGLNTRQTFDALRLLGRAGAWRTSMYIFRPVVTSQGFFDNSPDDSRWLWGAYAAHIRDVDAGASAVLYYHGIDRKAARFNQSTAHEQRHGVGMRVWGRYNRWDYNTEAAVQFGRFGDAQIRAWDLSSDIGLTFPATRFTPRVGVRFDVTSGDRDPHDNSLGTFNALFAGTAYSGLSGLIGPANSIDLAPSITLRLARPVSLTIGTAVFWRYSIGDGMYGIAVDLQRPGHLSNARHVGTQPTAQFVWTPTAHISITATVSYFRTGRFLRETPPGDNVQYGTGWITYRF
jgi:hypothetical protein